MNGLLPVTTDPNDAPPALGLSGESFASSIYWDIYAYIVQDLYASHSDSRRTEHKLYYLSCKISIESTATWERATLTATLSESGLLLATSKVNLVGYGFGLPGQLQYSLFSLGASETASST